MQCINAKLSPPISAVEAQSIGQAIERRSWAAPCLIVPEKWQHHGKKIGCTRLRCRAQRVTPREPVVSGSECLRAHVHRGFMRVLRVCCSTAALGEVLCAVERSLQLTYAVAPTHTRAEARGRAAPRHRR